MILQEALRTSVRAKLRVQANQIICRHSCGIAMVQILCEDGQGECIRLQFYFVGFLKAVA